MWHNAMYYYFELLNVVCSKEAQEEIHRCESRHLTKVEGFTKILVGVISTTNRFLQMHHIRGGCPSD